LADRVAYLLKGYPRLSELFIASEIHRVEQAGVPLRLYVLKPPDEAPTHPVVGRIRVCPEYLPATTSLSGSFLPVWLVRNVPAFARPLVRVWARQPAGAAAAAGLALAQAWRSRRRRFGAPRKQPLKEYLQAAALADRLLTVGDVRHLHAHFAHGTTSVAWLASRMTGIPFSFTGHAKDIYAGSLNPAGLLRRKLLAARFAVTCTDSNRQHLQALAPEASVHRLYHGLNADLAELLSSPNGAGSPRHALHVLGAGRLVEKKGFDVLLEACALLVSRGVNVTVTLAGEEGDQSHTLRRQVERLGLVARVRLCGPLSQAELLSQLRAASVFCLPCRVLQNGDRDGIPNVLVEAMASGVPVVTTPVSGIPELVSHGVNGLLVPPDDSAQLANALARLHGDADLHERLARTAEATVRERFDGETLARELAALFEVAT
jgi:glycosyltransferase involved in cell wall biosynthesis